MLLYEDHSLVAHQCCSSLSYCALFVFAEGQESFVHSEHSGRLAQEFHRLRNGLFVFYFCSCFCHSCTVTDTRPALQLHTSKVLLTTLDCRKMAAELSLPTESGTCNTINTIVFYTHTFSNSARFHVNTMTGKAEFNTCSETIITDSAAE